MRVLYLHVSMSLQVKHIGHGLFVSPEEHCHVKDVTAQEDENDLKSLYVRIISSKSFIHD